MNGDRFAEVTTRNDIARDIIAGFAAVTPTLTGAWRLIDTALADIPAALAELGRTRAELEAVRLGRANLLAAIRATLDAWPRARTTRCGTCATNWTRPRCHPSATGGHRDQIPADAPPDAASAARGHATHDGHQPW